MNYEKINPLNQLMNKEISKNFKKPYSAKNGYVCCYFKFYVSQKKLPHEMVINETEKKINKNKKILCFVGNYGRQMKKRLLLCKAQ